MSENDYWSETISLFSKILDRPPLKEKHLKRPSPKYLFFLIINTLKITDFPNGLFTEEEQTLEYFLKERDNRIIFFKKIIELIQIISKENLNIDINNILKGKECEKTNKFLQMLYKISTNGIDYSKVIEKYLIDNNYDLFWLKNKNDSGKGRYVLCLGDKNDFVDIERLIKENPDYRFISDFDIEYFDDLNNFFAHLRIKYFEIVFIIIKETFYADYYYKLKRYKNIIKCIPITIIYTSDIIQKKINYNIKIHYFTEEVYSSINDSFFNFGGVSTQLTSCLDFISNFSLTMKKEFNERKTPKSSFNGCMTFEYVNSLNQLIVPILYNEILNEETKVSDNEVQYFKYLLLNRHGEKDIVNLIHPLLYVKDMPHEILAKFFTKAYTEQTTFYGEMNNSLQKKKIKEYEAFIRIMYEGLSNKSLSISEDKELYRGSYLSKNEIDNIKLKFKEYKEKKDKSLPAFLLYSRCFLSFSKEKKVAMNFLGSNNDKAYAVLFVLKNNENVLNKYSSNADIENLSAFTSEKEVLFFPFTSFCLENIIDIDDTEESGKEYVKIELEYIGRYDVAFDKFKKNISLQNELTEEFVECFQEQNYSKELLNANIIKVNKQNDKDIEFKKNYIFKKFSDKIEEKYKIKVNTENKGNKKEKYNDFIDVNENYKIQPKKEEKILKEEIIVIEPEIKVELNNKIFFIDFYPSKCFTTIWKGNYNFDNQKHGKGEEYDIDGNIIFEGEYENGLKKEGKEFYYINQKLKYEGNYLNNKWYEGKLFNIKNEEKYEIKSGNGIIKEFYENGCLYYEGELKGGKKEGKGKIYDIYGSLIYDGKLINGIKNGKGKEYDSNRNLIFEGTFKNGKRMKIDVINKYNELGELIYKKDEIEENFLSIKDYKNHIMIKYGIWIMEKAEKNEEKEKENKKINNSSINSFSESTNNLSEEREKKILKKIKFEDEENDGKNGQVKEYVINNNLIFNLIFEGEYRNGKRYNGTYIIKMREKVYYYIIERGIFVQKKVEKINRDDLVYEGDCINGKGKIINIDGKILFIGKFKDGLKYEGKEFNSNKKLIYEGVYKGGFIFNGSGKEYLDKELIYEGEYKEGYKYKGNAKEYTKRHILLFEGEYDQGFKSKGKEYFRHGKKKFEGLYKDNFYYKGKEFNYDTQLIFEGEYKNKKRWEGKGKEFNKKDKDLIYEGEYKNGERTYGKIKLKKVVRTNRNNKLFEGYFSEGKKYEGVEYNKSENYIFEGKYSDGLKYKGKEYYFYNSDTLKFEGTYKNGLRSYGREYDYGRLVFEGEYVNGKRHYGKEYNAENEELVFDGYYENGEKKSGKEYDEKTEIITDGEFKNGKIWNGFGKEFKGNNNSIYTGKFEDGLFKNGKAREYNENNCLIFEGEYKDGEKFNGIYYEYDDNGKLLFIYKYRKGSMKMIAKLRYETNEESGKTLIYKISLFRLNNKVDKEEESKEMEEEMIMMEEDEEEKEEEQEYLIFNGELKNGQIWNGTGKELDLYNDIIFEGEFKEGKRWKGKGKEYRINNSKNELVFEGEYNEGKRWNGKGKEYTKKNKLIYEGKYIDGLNEKGLEYNYYENENKKEEDKIDKEYDEDDQLIFEGELKDGIRCKGKEYKDGKIIYEGDYKDGMRSNGKGIEYDSEDRKIFEGEYKEGKKWKGKSNDYNSFGRLLFKREYNNGEIIKEIEYNLKRKKIFEGEYKNGEKYKGKEYNDFGEIIFEGEYKDNERFEGKAKNNLYEFTYINGKINSQNISVYDYINHELFIGEYKDGEKYNGILRTYFDEINYILKREVEVKEGNINGKGKEYYGNQKLKYEGDFLNGKKNGEGILYFRFSGYINYIGSFKDGKKEGKGKEFDNWGNLIYEGMFSKDKRAE